MPPIKRLLRVERTEIVAEGELSRVDVQTIFNDIAGNAPAISFRYNYDKKADQTTIRFIPCRVYTVDLPPEIEKRFGDGISRERKIVIPGIITSRNDIIEKCWVPARKRAKRNDDNLKWVVITPRIVKDDDTKTVTTELSFFIETYDSKSKDPRGCAPENVKETLDRAADLMVEELRKIVGKEDSYAMEAAHILDEVSAEFSESLEELLYNS